MSSRIPPGLQSRAMLCRNQRGATLLVGLIMLLLLTLHAIAAFHTSSTQLRIAGNMRDRHAAEAAANVAIAQTLGAGDFAADPARVAATPVAVDLAGEGTPEFVVAMIATCTAVRPLPGSALDADSEHDFGCVSGAAFGATTLCVMTQWDVQATAGVATGSGQTGARSEVHQGAAVRMANSEAIDAC